MRIILGINHFFYINLYLKHHHHFHYHHLLLLFYCDSTYSISCSCEAVKETGAKFPAKTGAEEEEEEEEEVPPLICLICAKRSVSLFTRLIEAEDLATCAPLLAIVSLPDNEKMPLDGNRFIDEVVVEEEDLEDNVEAGGPKKIVGGGIDFTFTFTSGLSWPSAVDFFKMSAAADEDALRSPL